VIGDAGIDAVPEGSVGTVGDDGRGGDGGVGRLIVVTGSVGSGLVGLGAWMELERRRSNLGWSWMSSRGRSGVGVRLGGDGEVVLGGPESSGADVVIASRGVTLPCEGEGPGSGRGQEISASSGGEGPFGMVP
jgi:hypothetical protein